MRDIKCKCSHLKSEHKRKLWIFGDCDKCHCDLYMWEKRPTNFDKISMIVGIIMIAVSVIILVDGYYMVENKILVEQIEITPELFLSLWSASILLITVFVGIALFDIFIKPYLVQKYRRNFNDQ